MIVLQKNIRQNIPFLFLIILCFYSLMPFAVLSIALILFAFTSIAFHIKDIKTTGVKPFLIQSGFFIFMILSVIYSPDKSEGLRELQRSLPIIVIPFCFFFFLKKITNKKLQTVLLTFVASKFIFIIYIYNYFVYRISISRHFDVSDMSYLKKLMYTLKLPFRSVMNNAVYVVTNPPKIFFHKAYLSMSLLFAICIVAYYFFLKNKKLNIKTVLGIVLIIFFSLVLFHWFSIPNLALYFLLGFIFLMNFFSTVKHKLLVILLLIISSSIAYNIPTVNQAIKTNKRVNKNLEEVISFIKSPFYKEKKNDRIGSRAAVNECNLELMENALVFGYGIGAPKALLKQCYEEKNFKLGMLYKLNSHNYYFHIVLSSGLIALILFIGMFYNNFKVAFNQSDLLYFSFLCIIAINILTENTLFRAHGIVFFALFNSLLYKYNIDNKLV